MSEREIDYKQYEGERVISVSDLFEEILRKIWLVIIMAVLFAVIFAGYKYMSDKSKAEASTETASYEKLVSSLSEEEMREVDNVLKLYEEAETAEKYLNESIRMNIDPYNEDRVVMQFALEKEDSNLTEILQVLENYFVSTPLAVDLREYYPDEDTAYLAELVSFGHEDPTLDVSGLDGAVYQSNIFTVRVIHADMDSCEQLAGVVQQCLEDYLESISGYFGTCSITLIDEYAAQVYDSSLKTTQTNAVSDQISLLNKITTQTGYLNDTQVEVLEASLSGNVAAEAAEGNAETAPVTIKVHINKKYIALGLLIGIAVGIVLIVLIYICRGTLNAAQELQRVFHIAVLGQVHFVKPKNPLVRWWRRVTSKKKSTSLETEQRIAVTNLIHYCKKNQVNRILLTGSQENLSENAWLQEVKEALQKDQIDVDVRGGLPDSPEAVEKVNSYSHVALVETLRTSIYKDIIREVELCMEQNICIAGAIVLNS